MTQLRLKYGIQDTDRLLARYPGYSRTQDEVENENGQSRQAPAFFSEDYVAETRRRAVMERDNGRISDEDDLASRYSYARRDYFGQQSRRYDQRYECQNDDTAPSLKRSRVDDQEQERHDHERLKRRAAAINSYEDQKGRTRVGSPGQDLPDSGKYRSTVQFSDRRKAESGRLSYYDSDYQTPRSLEDIEPPNYHPKIYASGSSRYGQHSRACTPCPGSQEEDETKRYFPRSESTWVQEMADFNVDNFFRDVIDPIFSGITDPEAVVSRTVTSLQQFDNDGHSSTYDNSSRRTNNTSAVADPTGPSQAHGFQSIQKHTINLRGHQRTSSAASDVKSGEPGTPKSTISPTALGRYSSNAQRGSGSNGLDALPRIELDPHQPLSCHTRKNEEPVELKGTDNDSNIANST